MRIDSARLQPTKLHIPGPPTIVVERSGLVSRLSDSVASCRLTVIEAPAGSGKTTVLACWIARDHPRVAWISLDERDNRVDRFLAHLLAALAPLIEVASPSDDRLTSDEGREEVVAEIVDAISRLDEAAAMVLDDYQNVESSDVNEIVLRIVDESPETLGVVIASRSAPPLPLARLRVRGALGEIGTEDLRFPAEDAGHLIHQLSGVELTSEALQALNWRTEGWAAGLQLAALSLRRAQDPSLFIESFSGDHRHVVDFLMEEVWASIDPETKTHLMRLSVVSSFNASLCDALSGETTGRQVIDHIDKLNLFLVPLDSQREWYRFHRLFADLLKRQLDESEIDVKQLHRRAARWFSASSMSEEELEHWYLAEEWTRFMDMAVECRNDVWTYRPEDWIRPALCEVPDDEAVEHRQFLELLAIYLITLGDVPTALSKLNLLDRATRDDEPNQRAPYLAIRAFLFAASGRDPVSAESQARSALETASPADGSTLARARLALAIALLDLGFSEEAEELLATESSVERRGDSYLTFIGARVRRVQASLASGKLNAALLRLDTLDVERKRRARFPVVMCELFRAQILLQRARFSDCEKCLRSAFSLIEEGRGLQQHSAQILSARVHYCSRDFEMAASALGTAIALATRASNPSQVREAEAFLATLHLASGQSARLEAWMEEIGLEGYCRHPLIREREQLTMVKALIARGELVEAGKLAGEAAENARLQRRLPIVIEALCLEALAGERAGRHRSARSTLEVALELAAPDDIRLTFVELGEQLEPLASRLHLAYDPWSRIASEPSRCRPQEAQRSLLVEPLSDRELEVVAELLSGRSNKEMAEKLFVSTNTVKTHLRNIYGKLGVHSRGQAMAQARALGLEADITEIVDP